MKSKIALVTGASRGAGKGIALALADEGMTVIVTGRSASGVDTGSGLGGSLEETAELINERGGRGVPLACDHANSSQVEKLVQRVEEDFGSLHILVNNAFAVPAGLTDDKPFWEQSESLEIMFDVGLRSTYVMSRLAAPLLIAAGTGLIVNTSGFGGTCFMHGPAYGAVKAGVDKMAHDMAVDLRPHNIAAVSMWMGLLRTERTMRALSKDPSRYEGVDKWTESPEFTGRVIAALAKSKAFMDYSGKVLVAAEIAEEFGVVDIDGNRPGSRRSFLGNPPTFSDAVVR